MDIQTISTKELRENFSSVKRALERGQDLLLLYRSKPLAKMKALRQTTSKMRLFSVKQLKQWIKNDQLTAAERQKINAIIDRLP